MEWKIIGIGILLLMIMTTWFAFNCRIKFDDTIERWCIFYDSLEDNYEFGLGHRRDLKVGRIILPAFLNVFWRGGL